MTGSAMLPRGTAAVTVGGLPMRGARSTRSALRTNDPRSAMRG